MRQSIFGGDELDWPERRIYRQRASHDRGIGPKKIDAKFGLCIHKLQDGLPRWIQRVNMSNKEVAGQRLRGAIQACRNEIDVVQWTDGMAKPGTQAVDLHYETAGQRPVRDIVPQKLLKCVQRTLKVWSA